MDKISNIQIKTVDDNSSVKWMLNSIFLIHDDVPRHYSLLLVNSDFRVIQLAANLSTHTVVAMGWLRKLLAVGFEVVLSAWEDVT
jgi:hypothetical protein